MGCICSKGINKDEIVAEAAISIKRESQKSLSPSNIDEPVVRDVEANPRGNAVLPRSLSRSVSKVVGNGAVPNSREGDKKVVPVVDRAKVASGHHHRSATVDARANAEDLSSRRGRKESVEVSSDVLTSFSGEHVIAGWPPWLTSVAAEAIKGWLPRRADSFEKLDKIGQGTYSSVYRARDLETGKIVALKKVRFVNMDPESVRFMAREIHVLRRLDHPNVIKLEGIVTSRMSCSLYLVFEYMEHDLAGLAAQPGVKFTEPQVKCFMQQLLSGLEHCHSRGVLHRDIKGSNLLIDSNGVLRIGDFGLATVFNPAKRQPLTSRVVTLWYRPPELLLGATEYGVGVDLWSAGCILAELLAGKPIMPGRTEVEQLHKIFKLCGSPADDYWQKTKLSQSTIFKPQNRYPRVVADTFRDFPASALSLLNTLLAIEPEVRGTAASALQSEFFTTKPLACDPSSLPKYPPSKEYDAKLRDEEARRKREAARGRGAEAGTRGTRHSHAKPAQDNKTETQKRVANNKCTSEKFNAMEDSGAGFRIEPPSGDHCYPRVGSTMHPGAYGNSRMRDKDHANVPVRTISTVTAGPQLRTQRSYMPTSVRTGELSGFSCAASRNTTAAVQKKDDGDAKESTMTFANKKRIHYSGPLVPPGGNIDDMLKEHERQIQQAVRKARDKNNKASEKF